MDAKELESILDLHCKWLYDEQGGEKANLYGADLYGANLYGANLREADLREANLYGANLYEADLYGVKNIQSLIAARLSIVPEEGAFIGWKKAYIGHRYPSIVKLMITEDAKRSNATGRKCRASKAIVIGIEDMDGGPSESDVAYSGYEYGFSYRVGETVEPTEPFEEDRWDECASGIHFFITRDEAVDY